MLEAKIWKLNRRLAFLMSESMEWKQHFDSFQKFTDILSTESQALKTRLELERREHRTLTGVVAEQKSRQVELENRLLETEKAWMAAQVELAKAQEIREELQRQKEFMVCSYTLSFKFIPTNFPRLDFF
jgi:chromosome segregation ATPase